MKLYAIIILFLCISSNAYSQEWVQELKKLTLENAALQEELKLAKERSGKELQGLRDSIARLITVNKASISDMNSKINKLAGDTADLHRKISKLDKSNIASLKTSLKEKTDSIIKLNKTVKERDEQVAQSLKKEQEKYNEGQQHVYNQIGQLYTNNSFEYLVNYSTKQSVEQNLQLIGNNAEARKKLQELQVYFTAQQVLGEQYNEQKVKNVQGQINGMGQSDLVKNLNKKLEKYGLCNDALKKTIGRIIELDKKFIATDEYTRKTKLQDILAELSTYFRHYEFNFTDYPYLSDIVLEILKRKQKDANAEIAGLLSRL